MSQHRPPRPRRRTGRPRRRARTADDRRLRRVEHRDVPRHPAVGDLGMSSYCRFSTHYGSMGHAIGGAVGFCSATRLRAIVVTGDGSFDFMNPMRTAAKHGLRLTMLVLNDARLTLPYFGSERVGALLAQSTTHLEPWDFTRQGSRPRSRAGVSPTSPHSRASSSWRCRRKAATSSTSRSTRGSRRRCGRDWTASTRCSATPPELVA